MWKLYKQDFLKNLFKLLLRQGLICTMTFQLITFDVYIVIVWNWSPDQFEWSLLQSHFNLNITVHTVFHRHLIEDFWRQILAITNVSTKTRCVENFQEYFDKRKLQGIFWKIPQGFCSRCCTKLDLPQMPTLLLLISLKKLLCC